jgi:hypothetical protein
MRMHPYKARLFSVFLWLLLISSIAESQNIPANALFFDYVLHYEFKQPGLSDGKLLIRYNSLDKIVLYQFSQGDQWVEDHVFVHFDGLGDLEIKQRDHAVQMQFSPYKSTNTRNYAFPDNSTLQKYLSPHPEPQMIAGFESTLLEGTGPDGAYRKIYLMEDAFDARPIHQLGLTERFALPFTLAEAHYLDSDQLLMKSSIYADDQLLHQLELTWIAHDFYLFPMDSINTEETFAGLSGQIPIGNRSQLFQKYPSVWQEYGRLAGLNYEPKYYAFSRCYTYEWRLNDEKEGRVEVCFDPTHTVCGIYLEESDTLLNALSFLNRQIHLYKADSIGQLECFVYLPPQEMPPMDDLDYIRAASLYFQKSYQTTPARLKSYKDDSWFQRTDPEGRLGWIEEIIALRSVDFDPRSMHTGIHTILPDYPEFMEMVTPPYQLLTYWRATSQEGEVFECRLLESASNPRHFDDTGTSRFYKIY